MSLMGHGWGPCFSSSMLPRCSRWLRISFQTRTATRMTQTYLSFKPNSNTSQGDAVRAMKCCIEKIRHCLIHDRLLLNDDLTEFIIIGTRQQLSKLQAMNIKVGEIKPSSQVKNLGSWLDPNLYMRDHITNVCKAGFFYLHFFLLFFKSFIYLQYYSTVLTLLNYLNTTVLTSTVLALLHYL